MQLTQLAHWNDDESIPDRVPLLDRWLELQGDAQPLAGVSVLFIQHQLGNQVPQALAMMKLGVAPENFWWLDIPYTSRARVRTRMIEHGFLAEHFFPSSYRTLEAYGPYQRKRTQAVLQFLEKQVRGKLVVVDDGSYFLEAMACQKDRPRDLAIVEQTTRGLIKIEENAAIRLASRQVPIVNVARSDPKTLLEPPFIGHSVCHSLTLRLRSGWKPGARERCLVLGFGAIGQQVARFCVELGFAPSSIHVWDHDPARMRAADAQGFRAWDREKFEARFSLVLGCSGRASFTLGDYVYLEDGAVLGSASSGSVELSREEFIELADASESDQIWIDRTGLDESKLHSDLKFHFVDREAQFLNAGFPLNFDGRVNCVPMHYIQPTPTMMVAATVQAAQAVRPGLHELDPAFCRWVDREFRRELGEEAGLLAPPSYGVRHRGLESHHGA